MSSLAEHFQIKRGQIYPYLSHSVSNLVSGSGWCQIPCGKKQLKNCTSLGPFWQNLFWPFSFFFEILPLRHDKNFKKFRIHISVPAKFYGKQNPCWKHWGSIKQNLSTNTLSVTYIPPGLHVIAIWTVLGFHISAQKKRTDLEKKKG